MDETPLQTLCLCIPSCLQQTCEQNWLVVTSKDHFPIGLRNGEKTQHSHLVAGDEEVDNLIIQQVYHRAQHQYFIRVVCKYTEVFALLLYIYQRDLSCLNFHE